MTVLTVKQMLRLMAAAHPVVRLGLHKPHFERSLSVQADPKHLSTRRPLGQVTLTLQSSLVRP